MSEMVCLSNEPACQCLAAEVMGLLREKYALDIVCLVGIHGQVRFGEIENHLPEASTATLSARLAELTAAGLLEREEFDELPPRVEYAVTDEGEALADRLDPLIDWVLEFES